MLVVSVLLLVLPTVELDDQLSVKAGKVCNVVSDRHLPPESKPA